MERSQGRCYCDLRNPIHPKIAGTLKKINSGKAQECSVLVEAGGVTPLSCTSTTKQRYMENRKDATSFIRKNLTVTPQLSQEILTGTLDKFGTSRSTSLRGFLQKWKVACGADGLVPMRFAFFSIPSDRTWAEKRSQVIRSAAPVTQNHFPKTEDLMLQNVSPFS